MEGKAGMTKKDEEKKKKSNKAVRDFRERQKAKEQAGKEKADRLRKENLELESIVASCQQELNFMVEIVRAHAEADGKAFLNANPGLREFLE